MRNSDIIPKIDFSELATKKAVTKKIFESPLTLYPAGISTVAVFAIVVLGATNLLQIIAVAGFGVFITNLIVCFGFMKKGFVRNHVEKLHVILKEEKKLALESLGSSLRKTKNSSRAEKLSKQGSAQLVQAQNKFDVLEKIVEGKLNHGELTYNRFLGTAEQVFLSILDNLKHVVTLLKSISSIDVGDLRKRVANLKRQKSFSTYDDQELQTINKRIDLYEAQLDKVGNILIENEKALTGLDIFSVELSDTKMEKGLSSANSEESRLQLEKLASRCSLYELN